VNVHALNLEIAITPISIGDYDVDIEQFGDYQPKWPAPVATSLVPRSNFVQSFFA
jgi:hypothetical protein